MDSNERGNGIVSPKTIIANIILQNGRKIPLKSMVWGTVMELNQSLQQNPELLCQDPLMNGYLAVILPTGPFPPRQRPQFAAKDGDQGEALKSEETH